MKTVGQGQVIFRPKSKYDAHFLRLCAYKHTMRCMVHRLETLLSALADSTRLNALKILWDGDEHCVCELMERLGATQSRMSRHLARLKMIGLLTDRRDAQWVRHRRSVDIAPEWVAIIDHVLAALPMPPLAQCAQDNQKAA